MLPIWTSTIINLPLQWLTDVLIAETPVEGLCGLVTVSDSRKVYNVETLSDERHVQYL